MCLVSINFERSEALQQNSIVHNVFVLSGDFDVGLGFYYYVMFYDLNSFA